MAPVRSPEICLKLTYRYLLRADHVPDDTGAKFEQTWHRSTRYKTSLMVSDKIFSYFPYIGLCKICDHQGGPFLAQG